MRILLIVLKFLGIGVLILLGILVLLLLMVLFIPVRYQLQLKKKTSSGQAFQADGNLTYLAGLIRVVFTWSEQAANFSIRILGKEWKKAGKARRGQAQETGEKAKSSGSHKKETEKRPAAASEPEHREEDHTVREPEHREEEHTVREPEHREEDHTVQEPGHREEDHTAQEPERREEAAPEKEKQAEGETSGRITDQQTRAADHTESEREDGEGSVLYERLAQFFSEASQWPDQVRKRWDRIGNGIRKMKQTLEPFTDPWVKDFFRRSFERLLHTLRHFRIREIRGYLRFGTGRADLTGQATGLMYLLLPAGASRFQVEPDFFEKTLETDCFLKGRIRFCHVFHLLVITILDRSFWRLIRRIRASKHLASEKTGRRKRRN